MRRTTREKAVSKGPSDAECRGAQTWLRFEQVADAVIDQARHYLAISAPVGEYLADQLLIPLALSGGGSYRAVGISRHAQTNIEVIRQFLPVRIETMTTETGGVEVGVFGAP